MVKKFLFVGFAVAFLTSTCYAENYGSICDELASKLNRPDATSSVKLKAAIIKNGMLKMYGSPELHCKAKMQPVKKGKIFFVFGEYEGWKKIQYENDIEIVVSWVSKSDFDEMFTVERP